MLEIHTFTRITHFLNTTNSRTLNAQSQTGNQTITTHYGTKQIH